MAKGPDWNDVHRANPGAVRDALTEPDIPFDNAPAAQTNGNGEAFFRKWPPDGHSTNALELPAFGETFIIKASEITPEPISWLWKYWLARGKLHIIAGAPGTGKTTIYLAFAAIITSGGTWPDGTRAAAGNVLIWTSCGASTGCPRRARGG
jgi:hypothetical protein